MENILIGNGFNLEIGGSEFSNYSIIQRLHKNILTIRLLIFIVTKDLIFFYNKLILVLFMGQVNKKSDNPEV